MYACGIAPLGRQWRICPSLPAPLTQESEVRLSPVSSASTGGGPEECRDGRMSVRPNVSSSQISRCEPSCSGRTSGLVGAPQRSGNAAGPRLLSPVLDAPAPRDEAHRRGVGMDQHENGFEGTTRSVSESDGAHEEPSLSQDVPRLRLSAADRLRPTVSSGSQPLAAVRINFPYGWSRGLNGHNDDGYVSRLCENALIA